MCLSSAFIFVYLCVWSAGTVESEAFDAKAKELFFPSF